MKRSPASWHAAGIGIEDLRYTFEGHPKSSVFPTFSIRWGGAGAANYPDRAGLVTSKAPLSDIFAADTGLSGAPVAVMACVAMVNGILVQIVMASRVLYGMSCEGMMPAALGQLHPTRQTPVHAVGLIVGAITILGLFAPLLRLALPGIAGWHSVGGACRFKGSLISQNVAGLKWRVYDRLFRLTNDRFGRPDGPQVLAWLISRWTAKHE